MREYRVIRKIRKNGSSLAINIPKELIELMNLKEGELVEIEVAKIANGDK